MISDTKKISYTPTQRQSSASWPFICYVLKWLFPFACKCPSSSWRSRSVLRLGATVNELKESRKSISNFLLGPTFPAKTTNLPLHIWWSVSVYKFHTLDVNIDLLLVSAQSHFIRIYHGPSQSGTYSCVRDSLAIFTLNSSLIAFLVISKEFCCCDAYWARVEGRRE